MDRLIAIGDIHGCLNTLKELLKSVDYSSQTDTLVFVGDYIDRGANSCETVAFLRKLQQQVGKDNCICLRGNHEQWQLTHLQAEIIRFGFTTADTRPCVATTEMA